MIELTELIESLTEDAWRLLVLERDIASASTQDGEYKEMIEEYRRKSMRVFGVVRRDRQA